MGSCSVFHRHFPFVNTQGDLTVGGPWLVRKEDVFCRTPNSFGLDSRRYLVDQSGYC